jgi:hypothetical protein
MIIRLLVLGFIVVGCGTIHDEVVCTLAGCNPDTNKTGPVGPAGPKGLPGENCSVIEAVNGAIISCQDNSVLIVNGSQGIPGLKGLDGATGVDGQDGTPGAAGEKGETGEIGPMGPAGADSVYQITELIDPCGPTPGFVNEILLKLANGQLVASFSSNSSGANTRLGVLPPGNYQTTDTSEVGKRCRFTVTLTGAITNEELF